MKNIGVKLFLLIILIVGSSCLPSFGQPSEDYLIRSLDLLVDKTLTAYNRNDYIGFHEFYAKKMDLITQKRHFDTRFADIYQTELGLVFAKKLLLEKSNLDYDYPVLVYQAIFEKFEDVVITVNFKNQNDNYRITRIRFDRVQT